MKLKVKVAIAFGLSACCFPVAPKVSASNPASVAPTDGGFSMPRAQVRRLGLEKFMEVYSKGHSSTVGQMQGYGFYTRSRRADNNQSAQGLTLNRRRQVNALRDALAQLGDAAWDMTETKNGGGTMYGVLASSAYATREDAIATLIAALRQPQRSGAARLQVRSLFANTKRTLAHLKNMRVEADGSNLNADAQRDFNSSWNKAQAATTRLQQLVAGLPDNAARTVARRAFNELNNPVKNDEQE